MVKMVPYEAFAYPCGAGDVVLRESYKPKTHGKLYYACPRSKPRENTFECKLFLWKEERVRLLVGSPGASTTLIYSPGSSSMQFILQDLQHLHAILQELQHLKAILQDSRNDYAPQLHKHCVLE
ncbi:hypothetical protein Tco_1361600 [Tanacetum coccineum]